MNPLALIGAGVAAVGLAMAANEAVASGALPGVSGGKSGGNGPGAPDSATDGDHDTLARTIYGEARGEGYSGMLAVAWVVRNRVASSRWPDTYRGVCLQSRQFSCWNTGDPNRAIIQNVTTADRTFLLATEIAADVIAGHKADPTRGATNYFATTMASPPSWAKSMEHTVTIGHHTFYKAA